MYWSIKKINPLFEKFEFNCSESFSYNKTALEKYKDKVMAFWITEKYCFILLEGKRDFFGYKYKLDTERVSRDWKVNHYIKNKRCILDEGSYSLFQKMQIIKKIKNENN